jgi:PKD repeat protein
MKSSIAFAGIFVAAIVVVSAQQLTSQQQARTQNRAISFTGSPASGPAPLLVQFTSGGPQGADIGRTIAFGDGDTGQLHPAPVCATCDPQASVAHTYAAPGIYIATLWNFTNKSLGMLTITVITPQ